MIDSEDLSIEALCLLVVEKNKLSRERQIFRSRRNYYRVLLHKFENGRSVPSKFKTKKSILSKIKLNHAKQLLAEVKLHEFSSRFLAKKLRMLKHNNLCQVSDASNITTYLVGPNNRFDYSDIETMANNFIAEVELLARPNLGLPEIVE